MDEQAILPSSTEQSECVKSPEIDEQCTHFDSNNTNAFEGTESTHEPMETSFQPTIAIQSSNTNKTLVESTERTTVLQDDSPKNESQMMENQKEWNQEPNEMDHAISASQTDVTIHGQCSEFTGSHTQTVQQTHQPVCEIEPSKDQTSSQQILSNPPMEVACVQNNSENPTTETADQSVPSNSEEVSAEKTLSLTSTEPQETSVDAHQESRIPQEASIETPDTNVLPVSQEPEVQACEQIIHSDSTLDPVSATNPSQDEQAMKDVTAEPQEAVISDSGYKFSSMDIPQVAWESRSDFEKSPHENYLRGCKWAPDGSVLVANSNDNCLRVYSNSLYRDISDTSEPNSDVVIREGSQIYDFCWLPGESHNSTGALRIACTCSGIPVHLWDTVSGKNVASYLAYDQNDEITAAYSLAFSSDGSKLYCGFNKAVRIFDTERPGRNCSTIPTFNTKTKLGLTGIISCFAHCLNAPGFYAVGSYNKYVGIYDSQQNQLVSLLDGQRGGVTHIQFSPDGSKLYSGGRKDPEILCWDLRQPTLPLFSMLRDVKTNQRMYFDLSVSGRYLCSGNHDGSVSVWDTCGTPLEEVDGDMFLKPLCQFQAHADCVNAISFNHHHHLLATGSGQRHFRNLVRCYSSSGDDSSEEEDCVEPSKDFSLKLWSIPL